MKGFRRELFKKLEGFIDGPRDDVNMVDFLEMKFHLNMEIDKDEAYWE